MNQLEKMNEVYEKIKLKVEDEYESEEANELVNSNFTDKLVKEVELVFPFQYSSEDEGIYFFETIEIFKEYILERLYSEDIISSEEYYESSEDEWESSSC